MNKDDFKAKLKKIERLFQLETHRKKINSEQEFMDLSTELYEMVQEARYFSQHMSALYKEFEARNEEYDPLGNDFDIPF